MADCLGSVQSHGWSVCLNKRELRSGKEWCLLQTEMKRGPLQEEEERGESEILMKIQSTAPTPRAA